jgi:integrase/recombinase XerD
VSDVPGFVPRLLHDRSVSLFRADERVFDAMIEGWRAQMLARGLTVVTIKDRCNLIRRFQAFTNDFPWRWTAEDYEDFQAERRSGSRPLALSTLRTDSNTIAMFCGYLVNPAYGWVDFCERTFAEIPGQIVFDWNSPQHTTDDAVPPGRRSFELKELQVLFDYMDDLADREYAARSKRWLPVYRDSIAFKLCYAYGLRRREVTMLDTTDFGPNPHVPEYGMFGALTVRWAKGTRGSGPRRRTVLTVPEFDWAVPMMEQWTAAGHRDRFPTAERSRALWPSERGDRVTTGALGDSFAAARDAAGLPKELGLHCLRHSYVTHLIEAGYDPSFVQTQVGHSYASTTSLYTSVSADFKQKTVQQMIARRTAQREKARHD